MSQTSTITDSAQASTSTLKLTNPTAKISNGTHSNTHATNLASNPLNRVWRGDREGKIGFDGVPKFDNPYEEREWVKAHMAAAFRYWVRVFGR